MSSSKKTVKIRKESISDSNHTCKNKDKSKSSKTQSSSEIKKTEVMSINSNLLFDIIECPGCSVNFGFLANKKKKEKDDSNNKNDVFILKCGHNICSNCIDNNKIQFNCIVCLTTHSKTEISDLPSNFSIKEIANKYISTMKIDSEKKTINTNYPYICLDCNNILGENNKHNYFLKKTFNIEHKIIDVTNEKETNTRGLLFNDSEFVKNSLDYFSNMTNSTNGNTNTNSNSSYYINEDLIANYKEELNQLKNLIEKDIIKVNEAFKESLKNNNTKLSMKTLLSGIFDIEETVIYENLLKLKDDVKAESNNKNTIENLNKLIKLINSKTEIEHTINNEDSLKSTFTKAVEKEAKIRNKTKDEQLLIKKDLNDYIADRLLKKIENDSFKKNNYSFITNNTTPIYLSKETKCMYLLNQSKVIHKIPYKNISFESKEQNNTNTDIHAFLSNSKLILDNINGIFCLPMFDKNFYYLKFDNYLKTNCNVVIKSLKSRTEMSYSNSLVYDSENYVVFNFGVNKIGNSIIEFYNAITNTWKTLNNKFFFKKKKDQALIYNENDINENHFNMIDTNDINIECEEHNTYKLWKTPIAFCPIQNSITILDRINNLYRFSYDIKELFEDNQPKNTYIKKIDLVYSNSNSNSNDVFDKEEEESLYNNIKTKDMSNNEMIKLTSNNTVSDNDNNTNSNVMNNELYNNNASSINNYFIINTKFITSTDYLHSNEIITYDLINNTCFKIITSKGKVVKMNINESRLYKNLFNQVSELSEECVNNLKGSVLLFIESSGFSNNIIKKLKYQIIKNNNQELNYSDSEFFDIDFMNCSLLMESNSNLLQIYENYFIKNLKGSKDVSVGKMKMSLN